MKILIVSDAWHPQVNGVVRIYEELIKELKQLGHKIRVIGPDEFPFKLPIPFYREISFAVYPYLRLKRLIEEFKPDTIHIATEGPLGLAASKYCQHHQLAFTTAYHTQYPDYIADRLAKLLPPIKNWSKEQIDTQLKQFHTRAIATMVTNQVIKKELEKRGYKNRLEIITPGVDLSLFKPGPKTKFQNLTSPVALYVGRIAPEKNLESFLTMKWPGDKVLVGQGPSLISLANKYPGAHFLGKKTGKSLAQYYRSADVFVFPSKTDTLGLVMIEALASGTPVAAYNVTGPKDIISEPELGQLDSNLAKAALKAIDNGTAKQRHQFAVKNYSWRKAAKKFVKLLTLAKINQ